MRCGCGRKIDYIEDFLTDLIRKDLTEDYYKPDDLRVKDELDSFFKFLYDKYKEELEGA